MIKTTYFNNARKTLSEYIEYPINSLLALGCGILDHEKFIKTDHIVGVEWSDEKLKVISSMQNVTPIKYDFSKITDILVPKSFDTAIMFDAIEHLEKEPALKLLIELEKYVRKQILIFVPIQDNLVNFDKALEIQKQNKIENKSLGNHLSKWTPEEFDKMGYDVEVSPEYHKATKGYGAMTCVKTIKQ